jgi:hypothetical protein
MAYSRSPGEVQDAVVPPSPPSGPVGHACSAQYMLDLGGCNHIPAQLLPPHALTGSGL